MEVSDGDAGFVIVDRQTSRPYVDVVYRTREQASAERACLLRGYPDDHEWRRRLEVRPRLQCGG